MKISMIQDRNVIGLGLKTVAEPAFDIDAEIGKQLIQQGFAVEMKQKPVKQVTNVQDGDVKEL